jgi:hypothetical protein
MSLNNYPSDSRPTVKIYTSANYFALSLIDGLLPQFCKVEIVTKENERWRQLTKYLIDNNSFTINSENEQDKHCDYIIGCFIDEIDLDIIKNIIKKASQPSTKTIFIFPYNQNAQQYEKISKTKELLNQNSNENLLVYMGDHLGPRMTFDGSPFSQLIKSTLLMRKVPIPENFDYFPVFTPEATKEIVKLLFSFGPPANEVVIYSERLSPQELYLRLTKRIPNKEFTLVNRKEALVNDNFYLIKTERRLESSLNEVFQWFSKNPLYIPNVVKQSTPTETNKPTITFIKPSVKIEVKNKYKAKLVALGAALCLVIFTPFILLTFSVFLLRLGVKEFLNFHLTSSAKYVSISKTLSAGSTTILSFYYEIPAIGQAFKNSKDASLVIYNSGNIAFKGIDISKTANSFILKIFGDEVYNPEDYSNDIAIQLDDLYREIAFLDSETVSIGGVWGKAIQSYLEKINLTETRKNILSIKTFVEKAPLILGSLKPTSYLIIFQNNMELRPTGGFIGSFAIINFDEGKLSGFEVLDVYSADGQLKGHVEPPEPIKKYLGEANWYLRDANWDPDFPQSAARIEWFLNKEIDKSVDGVISFDLDVARELLKITGPISLTDFNEQITADNLYEKTQTEVEDQFFPGSIKKASFLSALAKSLLTGVIETTHSSPVPFAKPAYNLLQGKHIQLFLHDNHLQKIISQNGFSGEVLIPSCADNCYADWLGVVEANMGVNKANYYISRSASLDVKLGGGGIERQLTVTFKNEANPVKGLAGVYKNYFRLLLPQDAEFISALIKSGESSETQPLDVRDTLGMKELGTLIEILPGQTKSLILTWNSQSNLNFVEKGEYRLYWRKQAGTGEDPASLLMTPPGGVKTNVWPESSLTKEGAYVYNTTLARDIFSRISW